MTRPAAASAAARPSAQRRLAGRVRILPLTILGVALLLGLKIGSFWQGRVELFVSPAGAQQQGGQPTQLTPPAQPQPAQTAQQPAQTAQQPAQPPGQPPATRPPAGQPPAAGGAAPPGAAMAPGTPPGGPASNVQSLANRDPSTFTRAEIELLANLAQRRELLEQRGREIDLRESLLAAAEKRIDERIAELKKLEASIKQIVQQYDKQEEQNLQGLVKVYETMKPKDAARIFEKLDPNILLGVVERMKEAKLALVLSDMKPETAQELTVRLATRKQIPPSVRAGAESQLQNTTPGTAAPARPPAAAAAPAAGAAQPAPARPATGG